MTNEINVLYILFYAIPDDYFNQKKSHNDHIDNFLENVYGQKNCCIDTASSPYVISGVVLNMPY